MGDTIYPRTLLVFGFFFISFVFFLIFFFFFIVRSKRINSCFMYSKRAQQKKENYITAQLILAKHSNWFAQWQKREYKKRDILQQRNASKQKNQNIKKKEFFIKNG